MKTKTSITVAEGDGIGPEIMDATLKILDASGAQLDIHKVEIGEKVYLRGQPMGIDPSTWDTIRDTKAFLKAPITTPQGGGFKSLNVTVRTTLGLYANVRPCIAYAPFVDTKHPNMNVVIIRENEEDLYTGIEYRLTPNVYQALKVTTRPGCEKIIRYAFEYAQSYGRKKVTCFSKDNILKLTDGLFHKIFEEIGAEYPHIEKEHWIVDIGAAKLADTPTVFDVIVTSNLYGDILSDVAAQIAGSVGLAGSANIGPSCAMFEAIHGSAPRRAGQNLANPSGLLLASVMMLVHINQHDAAALVHNAWLKTLEDGIHTYDIFKEKISVQKRGTKEFADAVIERLGKKPEQLHPVQYEANRQVWQKGASKPPKPQKKERVGVDVFIDWNGSLEDLVSLMKQASTENLKLTTVGNRGVNVWPTKQPETTLVDGWRCRFLHTQKNGAVSPRCIATLLQNLAEKGVDVSIVHYLFNFDGQPGYTVSQNEQ
jgi:isocitrate dehydrogenase